MWVKRDVLDVEVKKEISLAKKLKNAFLDAFFPALLFFTGTILWHKIVGTLPNRSNTTSSHPPFSWEEIGNELPWLLKCCFFIFLIIFFYAIYMGKRVWMQNRPNYICDQCKKFTRQAENSICKCGGTIRNAKEFKWVEDKVE